MKKSLFATAISLCLVASFISGPASAAKKRRPVATTLYAHGASQVGEVDGAQWVANAFPAQSPFTFDTKVPTGSNPKSMTFASPYINSQCTGTPVGNPVFQGSINGTITGDVKLTAHFLSAPGTIKARLWVDTPLFSCNDQYYEPHSEIDFDVPTGQGKVTAVFPKLKLRAKSVIMVQILAPDVGNGYEGQAGRLLYDSTDAPTRLQFKCVPASGKSCTK